jgi:formylglycine-generating enzyme required for sulfatase activity
MLMRGEELAAAKDWLKAHPKYAPEPTLLQHEFIKAGEDAEAARRTTERQRLDRMIAAQEEREKALERERAALRRGQRALALVGALMILLALGGVGWWEQDYLQESINWFTTMRPYMLTQVRPYVLTAEAERALKPKDSLKECAMNCPEMIVVPPGEFMMGSTADPDENPPHKSRIVKPFAVSKFDVTFADWDACVQVGGCPEVSDGTFGRGTKPVISVTWADAQRYVAWFSKMTGRDYRLLSETEWEYVARAGTTGAYYWGNEIGAENANCLGCSGFWNNRGTSPVGTFPANAFGLYDMSGNVWQWVQDCQHGDYKGAPADGSAWISGDCGSRVVRGGSWGNTPKDVRVSHRHWLSADYQDAFTGFRIARTVNP